jgi:DUF1680 family protein
MGSDLASDIAVIVDTSQSPFSRLKPVLIDTIVLEEGFWQSMVHILKIETLNNQFLLLESNGRLNNLRRVFGDSDQPYKGYEFNDSDVYKWLEGASWVMAFERDEPLNQMVDQLITLITKARDKNGYINTFFSLERSNERWMNIQEKHELHCTVYLIQADRVHHRAISDSRLLDVALRLADYIYSQFGRAERTGTSGHPEIEMALVELYRVTRNIKYLNLAADFIDRRGHRILSRMEYYIDHVPFRQLEYMAGHVARALYLCSCAAD